MVTPAGLLDLLRGLGIPFRLLEHEAVMTVEESKTVRQNLEGALCKCLFLKSEDGGLWLVAVPADLRVNLKALAARLGCKRLSFAPAELMREFLGVSPGAVTLFGVVNDSGNAVRAVLEESLLTSPLPLNFHPLVNTASVSIGPKDLLRFLEHTGHSPLLVRDIAS